MSEKFEGPDKRHGWRFNKEISVQALLAILAAVMAAAVAWMNLNNRVSLLEQAIAQIASDQKRQDEERAFLRNNIQAQLRDLSDKFDRWVFRNNANREGLR